MSSTSGRSQRTDMTIPLTSTRSDIKMRAILIVTRTDSGIEIHMPVTIRGISRMDSVLREGLLRGAITQIYSKTTHVESELPEDWLRTSIATDGPLHRWLQLLQIEVQEVQRASGRADRITKHAEANSILQEFPSPSGSNILAPARDGYAKAVLWVGKTENGLDLQSSTFPNGNDEAESVEAIKLVKLSLITEYDTMRARTLDEDPVGWVEETLKLFEDTMRSLKIHVLAVVPAASRFQVPETL